MSETILIIARNFIPYYPTFGGVVRVLKMAEFFMQQGKTVIVLTAKGDFFGFFGYEELFQKLNIQYIDDWSQERISLRNSLNKTFFLNKILKIILPRMRKWLFNIIVPDSSRMLNKKFTYKAKKIIQTYKIRNIIISSPPHSTQLVGVNLKGYFGNNICIVADLRDSWSTGIYKKNNFLLQFWNYYCERKVLSVTDHITYTSPQMLQSIESKIFNITQKSTLVMNGYDSNMEVSWPSFQQNEVFQIGHFGKLDTMQNPLLFFEILQEFRYEYFVSFYGGKNDFPQYSQLPIHFLPSLPHNEALSKMRCIDILLIIISHKNANYVIPGKFFDYLLAQRPILFIGSLQNECAKIITEHKLGYVADINKENHILETLHLVYNNWQSGVLNAYHGKKFPTYSRQYQYQKLLNIFINRNR